MKALQDAWLFGVVAFLSIGPYAAATAGQEAKAAARPTLTLEQMQDFLINGEISRIREIGVGVTNPRRATVSYRGVTHDVEIQTVDISLSEFKPPMGRRELNFKDTYRYNIAAYRVARLLGLDDVPMSVERRVDRQPAAVTWWVDDVLMDESARRKKQVWGPDQARTAAQIHILRVFDELIGNTDRNGGNVLWTTDWTMWMIDHTRAFRLTGVRNPKLLERCERTLLVKLRGLTAETVKESVTGSLDFAEIDALLRRRDQIVQRFDAMIADKGEAAVLYTFIPR